MSIQSLLVVETRTTFCKMAVENEDAHECVFDEKGLCTKTKYKLRKSCHQDCGYCQRHHNQKCGKPPKAKRKALGDVTNKLVCGGVTCSSRRPLCVAKQCQKNGLCTRCCPCTNTVASQTAPKRAAKTEANLKMKELQIYNDEIDRAISTKANDPMGLKDLKNIFPCDVDLKNIPRMDVRSSNDVETKLENMSERALPTLITFFHHIVGKVAEVLLPGKPSFIIERLYSVVLSPIVLGYSVALKQVFVLKMATAIFQLAKSMPRNTTAYRVVGAIIAAGGNQRELEMFFADMEVPKLGRDARRRRQEDLKWMLETKSDPVSVERSLGRVGDELIRTMVYDILSPDNLHLLAVSDFL